MVIMDRVVNKGLGYAGVALSNVAGNAVATPYVLALLENRFEIYVESATTQTAAAVIITVILTPIITMLIVKKYNK